MITLNTRRAALTTFQPCDLFAFAVQLLTLPAEAARLLCRLCGMLRQLIGHHGVRAVGRHHNPEQLHLVLFGKAFDLDALPVFQFVCAPVQRVHAPIRLTVAGIIPLTIVLQRALGELFEQCNRQHQLFGSIPRRMVKKPMQPHDKVFQEAPEEESRFR